MRAINLPPIVGSHVLKAMRSHSKTHLKINATFEPMGFTSCSEAIEHLYPPITCAGLLIGDPTGLPRN